MSSQTFVKKTRKSFIRLLVRLKTFLFNWRYINSFYTRIHEVADDRAFLPVEEHVGADTAVTGTWQTAVSLRLLCRRPTSSRAWRARPSVADILAAVASSTLTATLEQRPWNGGGVKCLMLIGLSMTFFNIDIHRHSHFRHPTITTHGP